MVDSLRMKIVSSVRVTYRFLISNSARRKEMQTGLTKLESLLKERVSDF